MKEVICQWKGALFSSSPEDLLELKSEYKTNQLVRVKTYSIGAKKEASILQSNLLHACLQLVADEGKRKSTLDKIKFACKVDLHFVKEDLVAVKKDGSIVFQYDTFSFKNFHKMNKLRIYDRAFEWCAEVLEITVEELIKEAKSRMKSYT